MESIGRYQILGELGRGAMGVVYRALDPAIGRPVAIKTIRLAEFTDPGERDRLRERLFREAQSAGLLSHPGIVTIYDVGEQGDLTYIAMEFVSGSSLEKILGRDEPPVAQTVLNVLQQTAAALDFAHKKGIVHRDIKPANIMIDDEGTVKITDFGVAKVTASQSLTQAGTVLGTPNYMSPEQVQGRQVDGRADQFALGVITYEMLTGEKPFPGEHLTTVLYKIVSEDPAPPQHLNPTLGWPVAMVVARSLSKDPNKRYPSCTEFAGALDSALKTKKGWKPLPRGASQGLPTAMVAGQTGRDSTADRTLRVAPPRKRRLGIQVLAAALAGIGLVALAFVGAQRWFSEPEAAPPPPDAAKITDTPRPPPMPQAGAPAAGASDQTQPRETQPTRPEPAKPEEAASNPPPAESKPPAEPTTPPARSQPAASEHPLQIVTAPPGATAVLDNDPSKSCTSPCSFQVAPGRHVLAVKLEGHREERRIIEMSAYPKEFFVALSRPTGTVLVESQPAGAQILVDNQPRPETTPARIVLPAGKYQLTLIKDGRRAEQPIEVKDGSILKFELHLNP